MTKQRSRTVVLALVAQAIVAACGTEAPDDAPDDETASSETQAIAGCTGVGLSLYQQLCGVGESGGQPAVNFRNQWFRLDYDGTTWSIANSVAGAEGAVAPTDTTSDDTRPACRASCPANCPGGGRPCDPEARQACIEQCNTVYQVTEVRRFVWSVAGRTYTVEGTQRIENQRTINGSQDVRLAGNLTLTVTTADPADGNPWTLVAHPVRQKTDAADQTQANWEITEPTATTTLGAYNQLFSESQINAMFTPQVELMSAVKTNAPGASVMVARSNAAMNRALDAALPAGSAFQNHAEPEALSVTGSVLSRTPTVSGAGAYDLQRVSQFFMNDRRGHAGFSSPGSGERPLAQSSQREWRFQQNILNYKVTYDFLAGICGFEAWINSYIKGAFSLGRRACFDGVPTDVDMAGSLEFALRIGRGFGCNIVVASASASIDAGVRARAEFATSIDALSVPPALTASLNLYSDVDFNAHFKVRVLFWTKKWDKVLGQIRLFQRSASYRLASSVTLPAEQICTLGGTPADTGTCLDPAATCDVEGRCVRYDFSPTSGQPERSAADECNLPVCAVDPPQPTGEPLAFLPGTASCTSGCGAIPMGIRNPDTTECTSGPCDGLSAGFNRSLLSIPANVVPQILDSADDGQRAKLYAWEDGGIKKAVIDIRGVFAGVQLAEDIMECANDYLLPQAQTDTALAVNAKLQELYNNGYARNNVLIRGHSLGSLDTYWLLKKGVGAGNAIMLGVPLHKIVTLNNLIYVNISGVPQNPFPGTQLGLFVSPTDPVARGLPTPDMFGHWKDTWCWAKKGIKSPYNKHYPENIRFNVVETAEKAGEYFNGHYIGSYCAVAPVTCFREEALARNTPVTLQAGNGQYVTALNGGGAQVLANKATAGATERFVIESFGPLRDGGPVYVRTSDNQHFFTSNVFVFNFLNASETHRNGLSSFTIYRVGGPASAEIRSGDRIAFRSPKNGKYVGLEPGGSGFVINATAIGPSEIFQFSQVP